MADCRADVCIGHVLSADGSFALCFQQTLQSLWRAFFANCEPRHRMPPIHRLLLMQRAIVPILRFRWTSWPFQRHRPRWLDLIQRLMICICLGLRMEADETVERFVNRRGRIVSAQQARLGKWSVLLAKAVTEWHRYVLRVRNRKTWSAQLQFS